MDKSKINLIKEIKLKMDQIDKQIGKLQTQKQTYIIDLYMLEKDLITRNWVMHGMPGCVSLTRFCQPTGSKPASG